MLALVSRHQGDVVTLVRRIDSNWYEGRIGDLHGIVPASYLHILTEPETATATTSSGKIDLRVCRKHCDSKDRKNVKGDQHLI